MANEEHLVILKQGVGVWNTWRKEHPDVRPDLEGADLSGFVFSDADFSGANLRRANLLRANLSRANLSRANLIEASFNWAALIDANLIDADLSDANLSDADFSGANLSDADLSRAHLEKTDLTIADLSHARLWDATLSEATLSGADLSHARLSRADLSLARLSGADLSGADLSGANLGFADLSGADLSHARLSEATLNMADLRGANLGGVEFGFTNFIDTNLTGTTGLDSCRHLTLSNIDHRTLARSGDLSTKFLQGCGLPDWLIEAYKLAQSGLTNDDIHTIGYEAIRLRAGQPEAIQFHSCFISYSGKNDPFARRLHDDLQAQGVRCWFAPEDLKIGDRFRNVIEDAVRLHDKLLLVLSKESIKSQWVQDEVEAALEKERKRKQAVLFPIQIDKATQRTRQAWALKLRRERHIGDFCSWDNEDDYSQAFKRLLRDLRAS